MGGGGGVVVAGARTEGTVTRIEGTGTRTGDRTADVAHSEINEV